MKIRNGFVSNSSSSSFVIKVNDKFPTVRSVTEAIMNECIGNSGYEYNDELKLLKQTTDLDCPVHFLTSDGTWIKRFGDFIVVSSSQHIDFSGFYDCMVEFKDLPQEFIDIFYIEDEENNNKREPFTCNEDFDYFFHQFNDFLILHKGFYATQTWLEEKCEHCGKTFGHAWVLKGTDRKICECQENKILRSQKLKKIMSK